MIKQLLGCAAASALLMGVAHAQVPAESYSTTKTQSSTFGGASTETQQSYRAGVDGTVATKKQTVVRPDGSSETVMRKESTSPSVIPPATTSSTTTAETIR